MNKQKSFFITVFFVLMMPSFAGAEDIRFDHRTLGDRNLSFQLGLLSPLFFQDLSGNVSSANLTFGGNLALEIDVYLNNNWKMGGAVYGMASFTPNSKSLFMVPIMYRNTYEFKFFPFSVPLTIGTGIAISALGDNTQVDFSLMPQAGFFWNLNADYGIGLVTSYFWIPQIYNGSPIPYSQSRLGNFLTLDLAFTYHF